MDFDKPATSRVLVEVTTTFFYTMLTDSSYALGSFTVYTVL